MLTVTVVLASSGNSSTCRPLARRYSVTPSIEVTFCAAVGVAVAPQAAWPASTQMRSATVHCNGSRAEIFMIRDSTGRERVLDGAVPAKRFRLLQHPRGRFPRRSAIQTEDVKNEPHQTHSGNSDHRRRARPGLRRL